MTKYIFVTGGVVSSLGKGVTAAAIGRLLKSRGISVSIWRSCSGVLPPCRPSRVSRSSA